MRFLTVALLIALLRCSAHGQVVEGDDDDDDGDDLGLYNAAEIELDASKHDLDFFSFVTRPDLDAPRWDINVLDKSAVAPGYWFVAPYGVVHQTHTNHAYVAPHIYDTNGELVWSGAAMFEKFNVFSFKVSQVGGKPMATLLHHHEGKGYIIDHTYKVINKISIGKKGYRANMHEFQIVDGGTRALHLTSFGKYNVENARRAGYEDGPCRLVHQRIEERDIHSGEITFEWASIDRISPEESYLYESNATQLCTRTEIHEGITADYLHVNAVEKLPDGDYLISARHTDAIYKISKTGELLWRLGGRKSDFELPKGVRWSGQHDVRCLSQNRTHLVLTIFDNAHRCGWPDATNSFSRGLTLSVDTVAMTAKVISEIPHPFKEAAMERGNYQTLPNGNSLIFWTNDTLNSEHTPDGRLIKTAKLPSGLKTYRGYKFDWHGEPHYRPDVHSEVRSLDGELSTIVHVSWNGATSVDSWKVYENVNGNHTLLVSGKKTGFETALVHRGYARHVVVEATDRLGRVLKTSLSFATVGTLPDETGAPTEKASARPFQPEDQASDIPQDLYSSDSDFSTGSTHFYALVVGLLCCVAAMLSARRWFKFVSSCWQRSHWKYSALETTEKL